MASTKDKMQDVMPLSFDYKRGEQPSSEKLTKWAELTDIALERVVQAIGDPWDYQPHTSSGTSRYFLSPENLSQVNLARFNGPSSYVSPVGNTVGEEMPAAFSVTLSGNRNTWCLGFPLMKSTTSGYIMSPTDDDSVLQSIDLDELTFSGAEFVTRVNSADLVSSAGEYYVDWRTGTIVSYSIPSADSTLSVSSSANLQFFGAGAPWTTHNVIPDWSDSGNGSNHSGGVIVTYVTNVSSAYTYSISMPNVYGLPRVGDTNSMLGTGVVSSATFGSEGSQYRLPYSLWSGTTSGDVVPEGFLFLWDNDTSSIVPLTEFTIGSTPYELSLSCSELGGVGTGTNNSRYRIITLGSSLAETIGYLSAVVRNNTHAGLTSGSTVSNTLAYTPPLDHQDLIDRYSVAFSAPASDSSVIDKLNFVESKYPTNGHPQYLHRAGFLSEDTANSKNAMRGYLAFTGRDDYTITGYGGVMTETYGLLFGAADSTHLDNSPKITWEGGESLTPGTGGSSVSTRLPFGNTDLGLKDITTPDYYGGLTISPYYSSGLFIRGNNTESPNDPTDGAVFAMDLGRKNELNYVKLRNPRSYNVNDYHRPAQLSQSNFNVPLSIMPDATGKVALNDFREFRFRATAHAPFATNTSGVRDSSGTTITEFEKYFLGPGVVGTDFLNVYSNAIFFSDTGDGTKTSLHDAAGWFNDADEDDRPIGIYYEPTAGRNSKGQFRLTTGSTTSTHSVAKFGMNEIILSTDEGAAKMEMLYYSDSGGFHDKVQLSVKNNDEFDPTDNCYLSIERTDSPAPGIDYAYSVEVNNQELDGSVNLNSYITRVHAGSSDTIDNELSPSSGESLLQISTEGATDLQSEVDNNNIMIASGNSLFADAVDVIQLTSNGSSTTDAFKIEAANGGMRVSADQNIRVTAQEELILSGLGSSGIELNATSGQISIDTPEVAIQGVCEINSDGTLYFGGTGTMYVNSTKIFIFNNSDIEMPNLPTTSGAPGVLYNDNGTLKVSS